MAKKTKTGDDADGGDKNPPQNWTTMFLDLALFTRTTDDPAPFCWAEWQAQVTMDVPPWALRATPAGTGMSAEEISQALAYARAYWAAGPNKRGAFYRASRRKTSQHSAGHEAIAAYMRKRVRTWKLNSKVDAHLEANNWSVYALASPDMTQLPSPERANGAIPELMLLWFGQNTNDTNWELSEAGWGFFKTLLYITWARWRMHLGREKRALRNAEDAVEASKRKLDSEGATPANTRLWLKCMEVLVTRVNPWRERLRKTQHAALVEELEGARALLQQDVHAPEVRKLSPALRAALLAVPSEEEIERCIARIDEVLRAAECEGVDLRTVNVDLSTWLEGVEEYKKLTIDEMRQWAGLPSAHLPSFNHKIDLKGNSNPWTPEGRQALASTYASPLTPFWHQWIGVTKIMDNAANKRNTIRVR
ncbi:hypothetical protein C2E23DRAFT_864315, partial [Lenzites betulinus]